MAEDREVIRRCCETMEELCHDGRIQCWYNHLCPFSEVGCKTVSAEMWEDFIRKELDDEQTD